MELEYPPYTITYTEDGVKKQKVFDTRSEAFEFWQQLVNSEEHHYID